jgi:PPK2 family polyphosphate:nucleotide phosphotransferase
MWRAASRVPERGRVGIFNRSYYEEVLVVRVHQGLLTKQHVPSQLITKDIWHERMHDMCRFEDYLTRNGIVVRKFFLNVSKEEQRRRFLKRLEEPEKNWKFSAADVRERQYWDDYMNAYEDMIRQTATRHAPWYVVPADHKWFTRLVVGSAMVEALKDLKLAYPKVDPERRKELEVIRASMEGKRKKGRQGVQ